MKYTDVLVSDGSDNIVDIDWGTEWDSGYVAATEGTNMTQSLPLYGYVLNGTSRK